MWEWFLLRNNRNVSGRCRIGMYGEPSLIRLFMGEDAGRRKHVFREAALMGTDTLIALLALVVSIIQLAGRNGKL